VGHLLYPQQFAFQKLEVAVEIHMQISEYSFRTQVPDLSAHVEQMQHLSNSWDQLELVWGPERRVMETTILLMKFARLANESRAFPLEVQIVAGELDFVGPTGLPATEHALMWSVSFERNGIHREVQHRGILAEMRREAVRGVGPV